MCNQQGHLNSDKVNFLVVSDINAEEVMIVLRKQNWMN